MVLTGFAFYGTKFSPIDQCEFVGGLPIITGGTLYHVKVLHMIFRWRTCRFLGFVLEIVAPSFAYIFRPIAFYSVLGPRYVRLHSEGVRRYPALPLQVFVLSCCISDLVTR